MSRTSSSSCLWRTIGPATLPPLPGPLVQRLQQRLRQRRRQRQIPSLRLPAAGGARETHAVKLRQLISHYAHFCRRSVRTSIDVSDDEQDEQDSICPPVSDTGK